MRNKQWGLEQKQEDRRGLRKIRRKEVMKNGKKRWKEEKTLNGSILLRIVALERRNNSIATSTALKKLKNSKQLYKTVFKKIL